MDPRLRGDDKARLRSVAVMSLLLCLTLLSACGGSGANPTPKMKQLGGFRVAQTCEDIREFVNGFAKRTADNPDGIVGVQSDGFSRGESPAAAPTGAESDQAGAGETVQSDIAFPDRARGLLFTASLEKKLKVFKVSPAGETQLAATLTLDFTPLEMLAMRSAQRDLLLLFGSTGSPWFGGPEPFPAVAEDGNVGSGTWEEPKSVVVLLDVSDLSQIKELKRETAPGSFLEARAIPGKSSALWVSQRWVSLQSDPVPEDQVFPDKSVKGGGAVASQPVVGCAETFLYQNDTLDSSYAPYSLSETVIHRIDLSVADYPVSSQAIFSPAWRTVIAANSEHLFLAQNIDSGGRPDMELFQFDIPSAQSIRFSASGQVPGDILNQFFIDEREGVVRVFHHQSGSGVGCADCAVGTEPGVGPVVPLLKAQEVSVAGNYLSTFRKVGDKLELLGRSGPFEETEVPFAARFIGKLGCVITFLQIDPLTCFDLQDPAKPIKLGELEIAGVSFHLEPVSETLLLGIGRGEGNGSVVANLFDISDPSHPKLSDQEILVNSDFAWSPVFYDHRALGKDTAAGEFSIPIDGEQNTYLKRIRVNSQEKTLSILPGMQKNFGPDGYDSYQRGFFFDDTLAALSISELEVFLRSDGSKLFTSPLN